MDNHQNFLQFASCQQNYNHNESSRFSIKLKMVHKVGLFKVPFDCLTKPTQLHHFTDSLLILYNFLL